MIGISRRRPTVFRIIQVALGCVLLTAAGLKGYQLATEAVAETSVSSTRWLLLAVVEFELMFALWLLAGVYSRLNWLAALVVFGIFAVISLIEALTGKTTCGCFGNLEINPWYTFSLDAGTIVALSFARPILRDAPPNNQRLRLAVLGVSACLIGIPGGFAIARYAPARLSADAQILGDSEFVILDPEAWIGHRFPLLGWIEMEKRMDEGLWIVLLYKSGCGACRDAASRFRSLSAEFADREGTPRIALLATPPYEDRDITRGAAYVTGRLQRGRHWLVSGANAVLIDNGVVRTVFRDARDVELIRKIWLY